jgi:hypothetical protein
VRKQTHTKTQNKTNAEPKGTVGTKTGPKSKTASPLSHPGIARANDSKGVVPRNMKKPLRETNPPEHTMAVAPAAAN